MRVASHYFSFLLSLDYMDDSILEYENAEIPERVPSDDDIDTLVNIVIGSPAVCLYCDLEEIVDLEERKESARKCCDKSFDDTKEIGIEIHESPVPVNGNMNIALYSDNMQLITLFHAHMRHLEEKNSPMYDKEMYKAEIEDTLQIFNVRISDYI